MSLRKKEAHYAKMLEDDGWLVTEAADGRDGLARAAERHPEVVLLDLTMPQLDGFDFLMRFRTLPGCTAIPVVVLTARDLTNDDRRRPRSANQLLNKGDLCAPSSNGCTSQRSRRREASSEPARRISLAELEQALPGVPTFDGLGEHRNALSENCRIGDRVAVSLILRGLIVMNLLVILIILLLLFGGGGFYLGGAGVGGGLGLIILIIIVVVLVRGGGI